MWEGKTTSAAVAENVGKKNSKKQNCSLTFRAISIEVIKKNCNASHPHIRHSNARRQLPTQKLPSETQFRFRVPNKQHHANIKIIENINCSSLLFSAIVPPDHIKWISSPSRYQAIKYSATTSKGLYLLSLQYATTINMYIFSCYAFIIVNRKDHFFFGRVPMPSVIDSDCVHSFSVLKAKQQKQHWLQFHSW